MEGKKTAIASLLTIALPLIPGVKDVVQAHPQESMGAVGGIFFILRILTKGKIDLSF